MKFLSLVIAFSCICVGSWIEEAGAASWMALDGNHTVFKADMGIEANVVYNTSANKTQTTTISFNNSTVVSASVNGSNMDVSFNNTNSNEILVLTFASDDKTFKLQKASLSFSNVTDNKTTTLEETLTLFETKLNESHQCSIETQFRIGSGSGLVNHAFVRFTVPEKSTLKIQAFSFQSNNSYGNASQCPWDTRNQIVMEQKFEVQDNKTVCAIVQTMMELNVEYKAINGMMMMTKVPIKPKDKSATSGSCSQNKTTVMIELSDNVGNLTLGFSLSQQKSGGYSADKQMSVMDTIKLEYDPTSTYFPNHESTKSQTLSNSTLSEFVTSSNASYRCLGESHVTVNDKMNATFNQTQMQAFNVKNDSFSDVDGDCQAVVTTSAPATTKHHTSPTVTPIDPAIPVASDRIIKDDKTNLTCLHGFFGLQLLIAYNNTKSKKMTDGFFNFNKENITTTGTCDNTTAVLTFVRNDDKKIELTFTKKDSKTSLTKIVAMYDANKLPDHSSSKNGSRKPVMDVMKFETPLKKSYNCTEGSDIFISDADGDFVVVRLSGLILETFPESGTFAPESKCFQDQSVAKPTSGQYYINGTGTANKTVCAAFVLTVDAVVTYKQLVDYETKTAYIPLQGMKNYPNKTFGTCDEGNTTILKIPTEDRKLNFTFTFKKKNISGSQFEFRMTGATLEYSTDSKYFPNHEYIKGGMNTVQNLSLSLFSSDQDHSYKCSNNVTAPIADVTNIASGNVFFADVQAQPFGVDNNSGDFKAADDCQAPNNPRFSKTAKIAIYTVAGVLAVILIVGIGFFCRRKYRQRKMGYKAFS